MGARELADFAGQATLSDLLAVNQAVLARCYPGLRWASLVGELRTGRGGGLVLPVVVDGVNDRDRPDGAEESPPLVVSRP